MAVLYCPHFVQFFDSNGVPLAGGKLYTYIAGTVTPKATFTDSTGTVQNANPIILDASGRATIFLDGSYKFRLETALNVLVRETDNVQAFITTSSGTSVGETKTQSYASPANFTPGVTTSLTLTTTPIAASSASLNIYFDGVYQHPSEWQYEPSTGVITFNEAIRLGVLSVSVNWQSSSLSVGTVSSGSIDYDKIASGTIASVSDIHISAPNKLLNAANLYTALRPYSSTLSTTSGTSIDFSGIPSSVRSLELIFTGGVKTDSTSDLLIQIGDSGGIETTAYLSSGSQVFNAGGGVGLYTAGFGFSKNVTAHELYGIIRIRNPSGNLWVLEGSLGSPIAGGTNIVSLFSAGEKTLSAVLDRIRITTVSGTANFTKGSIMVNGYSYI